MAVPAYFFVVLDLSVYLPDGFSATTNCAIIMMSSLLQSAMVPDTNAYSNYPEDFVSQWVLAFIEHLLTVGPHQQE
jgi:hypothetical protein